MKKLTDWFTDLTIGKVVLLILIIILIYVVYRQAKKIIIQIKGDKTVRSAGDDVIKKDLSYQESQYRVYADTLESAMKGLGTDEDTIYSVFNDMQTKSDVLKLIAVFGTREYNTGYLWGWFSGTDALPAWLRDEGSSVVSRVNSILSVKGINFQF